MMAYSDEITFHSSIVNASEVTFYSRIVNGSVEFTKVFDLNGGLHVSSCKEIETMDLLGVKGLQSGLEQLYKETKDERLKVAIKSYLGDSIAD
ncbi:hypothetical protein [Cetobacterium sp.]|uniref:hypothetical protein n=1 Tax=Cetobacterium sp. TaxID=2071632 RepID=UPI003F67D727